jgi:hypothetical protein
MLEANQIEIPEMVFYGWEEPEGIQVFYYENPETGNKVSSGFAVSFPKTKEGLLTDEFKKKLEEMSLEKVVVVDHNDEVGDLETTYSGVTSSGVEVDESQITFSFSAESSLTYLKPNFF